MCQTVWDVGESLVDLEDNEAKTERRFNYNPTSRKEGLYFPNEYRGYIKDTKDVLVWFIRC